MKHAKKQPFFSLFLPKKNIHISEINSFFFVRKKKSQENKLFMKCDGQHLVNFLDHTNMPNCP